MRLRTLLNPILLLALLSLAPALMHCTTQGSGGTAGTLALNNTTPVAVAGGGGEAAIGGQLVLDGRDSYDPDGDEIKFIWSIDSKPETSALGDNPFSANDDRNAGVVTITLDVEGVFIFGLIVEDTEGARSATDYVIAEATPDVQLPVADAGADVSGIEGTEICLDGGASHDPSGLPLAWAWSLVSVPEGSQLSTADLQGADTQSACFTPDDHGTYTVALVVSNGLSDSEPDFAFAAIGSTNQGPTAAVGIVSAAACGFIVLTAAGSTDPEGDTLQYNWDLLATPPGSAAILGQDSFVDPQAEVSRFYADVEGRYTVQLVVNDGEDYSMPVFVDVVVEMTTVNSPPVVVPSPDVYYGAPSPTCGVDSYGNCTNCPTCPAEIVPLDALATTDPDGDTLTITWELVSGPANTTLAFTEGWINELSLPGPPGSCYSTVSTYQAQVRVTATDCPGASASALITILYDCGV